METKLTRIAEIAKREPKERFISLYHLLNVELLRQAHRELDSRKATGVDQVTKGEYEQNLEENLVDLVGKLKQKAYRPQPARRTYIPKDERSKRPLGIPAHEDKIVQSALKKLLQPIYEQDFLPCSYGFRPGKSCHDALKELDRILHQEPIHFVVDADIRGFFNHVDHDWMTKFLEVRIRDPNVLRLVRRMLKAGVQEDGKLEPTEEGTPQGSIISPLLANIYLHYVLDLWFEKQIKRECRGKAFIIRYADDYVCCFQYEEDARSFYQLLRDRLAKFGLSIAEEKTQIIRFGKYAEEWHNKNGGKPGTFTFLGFTYYCSHSRKGKFQAKPKTSAKKYRSKIKDFTQWMKAHRHDPIEETMKTIGQKLLGHYQYYGITHNFSSISKYRDQVRCILFKWLNRRSQKKSFTVEQFQEFLKRNPLPKPKIYKSIYR